MDRFAALSAFVRVIEAQGFAPAARRIGVATSSVTRQVDALEAVLKTALLNRFTRQVTPTEAGRAYYARAVRLLEELAAADAEVTGAHSEPRGNLRVSAPVTFARRHLAPLIPDFLQHCPAVTIEMTLSDAVVDLAADDFDLAVRLGPVIDMSLIARGLGTQRRLLCASPDYIAARGAPMHPASLAMHGCLLFAYGDGGRRWQFDGPEGPLVVEVSGPLRCDNSEILLAAALAGAGIVLLPSWLVGEDLAAGRLVPLLPEYRAEQPLGDAAIRAVWLPNRRGSVKVRAFVEFLAQRLPSRLETR